MSALVDWRGSAIEAGATVVYTTHMGDAKYQVEATVAPDTLTPSGRVRLTITRLSRFCWPGDIGKRVTVAPEFLTVVT